MMTEECSPSVAADCDPMMDPTVIFFAGDSIPVPGAMPSCCQGCPELSIIPNEHVSFGNQLDATVGYDKIAIACSAAGAKERPMAYVAPITASYSIAVQSSATQPLALYVLHSNCYGDDFNGCTPIDPAPGQGSQTVALQAGERIIIVVEEASPGSHAYPFMLQIDALPTPTPTATATVTATRTFTATRTATRTATATNTRTATATRTRTATRTSTFTVTATRTPSRTRTATHTHTQTPTRTATRTATPSRSATASRTASSSPTATNTAVASATRTATSSPTATVSATPTRSASPTASANPTRTGSSTHTPTSTRTQPPSATASSTRSATPTHTATPIETVTATATRTGTATASSVPAPTGTATPTQTATMAATPTATATPSTSGTSSATPTPTATTRSGFASSQTHMDHPASAVGSGSFGPRTASPGATPSGTPEPVDLVVGGRDEPLLNLIPGHGDGTFASPSTPVQLDGVGGLADLAVVDLDGDGRLDVVATDPDGDQLLTARGDDSAGLSEAGRVEVRGAPQRLAVADVTADGAADVLVATADSVVILRNRGDGGLDALEPVAVGGRATDIAIADVNGDGRLDLLAAVASANALQIYFGAGDGSFTAGPHIALPEPVAIAVGELTCDLRRDVAVATAGDQQLVLLAGTGDGLGDPQVAVTGISAMRLLAADVDRDGRTDLIALDAMSGGAVVLLSQCRALFTRDALVPAGESPGGLTVADFNGDGLPDIALTAPGDNAIVIGINVTVSGPPPCAGDCDANREVTINELIAGVNLALGETDIVCAALDTDGDGEVSIGELITAVSRALGGCSR